MLPYFASQYSKYWPVSRQGEQGWPITFSAPTHMSWQQIWLQSPVPGLHITLFKKCSLPPGLALGITQIHPGHALFSILALTASIGTKNVNVIKTSRIPPIRTNLVFIRFHLLLVVDYQANKRPWGCSGWLVYKHFGEISTFWDKYRWFLSRIKMLRQALPGKSVHW